MWKLKELKEMHVAEVRMLEVKIMPCWRLKQNYVLSENKQHKMKKVASDIALPMDAVTIDVTRVVALRFRLPTIAIYRSSAGGCNSWVRDHLWAFRQLSVWFGIVSINVKLQNDERGRKGQHL
ncbi:UNVERIFIED_CONTAM: hypothetical protein NCL1_30407 [Trichonephila clavipes]